MYPLGMSVCVHRKVNHGACVCVCHGVWMGACVLCPCMCWHASVYHRHVRAHRLH